MKKAIANEVYTVIAVDSDGCVTKDDSYLDIDQFEGDILEVWKEREDGFVFVYCHRLEVGYWVLPSLITIAD